MEDFFKWSDWIFKIFGLLVTILVGCITIDINRQSKNISEQSIELSKMSNPLRLSVKQLEDTNDVTNSKITDIYSGKSSTINTLPVKVNVMSGTIGDVYSIVSYFHGSNDTNPIVNISPSTTNPNKDQTKDDIKFSMSDIGGFVSNNDNDTFAMQSLVIKGSGDKNYLISLWVKGSKQGYVDELRAVGTNGSNEPEEVRQQYLYLKNYLNSKGLNINS